MLAVSHSLGGSMHLQAWYLRKCMTLYNDVARRPHLPREVAIRRILMNTGIDISLYGPPPAEEYPPTELDDVEEAGDENENGESEGEEVDDPCSLIEQP